MASRPIAAASAAGILCLGLAWWMHQQAAELPGTVRGQVDRGLLVKDPRLFLSKVGSHAHLVLTAEFSQTGSSPLRLEPPLLTLLTAQGSAAPRYLGPLLPEPVLANPAPARITLHYWLPSADLGTAMILEAGGKRYPLKVTEMPAPFPR